MPPQKPDPIIVRADMIQAVGRGDNVAAFAHRCFKKLAKVLKTAGEFRPCLAGSEPAVDLEGRQTGRFRWRQAFFWGCRRGAGLLPYHGQKGLRPHRQRDMAVPACPTAHLIVIQADLTFGRLEALLDRPACAHHLGLRVKRRDHWGIGTIRRDLVRSAATTPEDHPALPSRLRRVYATLKGSHPKKC